MNLSKIKDLLKIVAESGVAEVEIEEEDFRLGRAAGAPRRSTCKPVQAPPVPYYAPMPYPSSGFRTRRPRPARTGLLPRPPALGPRWPHPDLPPAARRPA